MDFHVIIYDKQNFECWFRVYRESFIAPGYQLYQISSSIEEQHFLNVQSAMKREK